MKKLKIVSVLTVICLIAPSIPAAGHSEDWCADAVDFAMRTAQYRDLGRSRDVTLKSIEHDKEVFQQQYPDLPVVDMRDIALKVYKEKKTHFGAAVSMAKTKTCPAVPDVDFPALVAIPHSDEWCANALDLAMGVAQNRELKFSEPVVSGSFDQNPTYYHMQYPELTREDMMGITGMVYQKEWTRFGAAAAVSVSCKLGPAQPQQALLESRVKPD